ncbi:hypothetical protein PVA45_05325 [Entomospira entomophila]|uniref:Outer membrane protein beta-barrel domain-containing protein n=1 Tax=Entomospira entomophila TaxID=2719988 RepID=A0A968KWL6_9SPIO|nr:hypothetical protein [Entomospira entomophilus]NIZ40920.1 hypothetical protein [Entomospira entomophilus]WDI35133.1 hypothetical protein PVA45_05325 [Entomospira entomophilus]
MQKKIMHMLVLVSLFMAPFTLYASTDEDYEEGYSRGYSDAQAQAERDHQEAIEQARIQGKADGEAEKEAAEREAKEEGNALEESYRQGYRDGVEDSRKANESQNNGNQGNGSDQNKNTESEDDDSVAEQPSQERPKEYPQERPQDRPRPRSKERRDPVYQFSLNFTKLYMWDIFQMSYTRNQSDYVFQLNNTFFLTNNFGIGLNIGMNRSRMGLGLNFYNEDYEFSHSSTATLIHYGLDLNLLFHTRAPLGRFFAFTMDLGWYYTYNAVSDVRGLTNDEERAYNKSSIPSDYRHMHGPIFQVGFEVGGMKSLGVYVPFGYTLRYNISQTVFMHGFYVGLGLKI